MEATSCFKKAFDDTLIQHHVAATSIGTHMLSYLSTSNEVALTLVPRDGMTWKMWFEALSNLVSFVLGEKREYHFIVLEEGHEGEVGYGNLVLMSKL